MGFLTNVVNFSRVAERLAVVGGVIGFFVSSSLAAQDPPPPGTAILLTDVELDRTRLRVHFIDIGPGLAVLIETPNDRRHIFIDGGKWGLDDMETYVRHFADPTTTAMDIAIVTHPDFDHFSGMRRIFNLFDVREFWYTGYDSDELSTSWRAFEGEVEQEEDCAVYWPLEDFNAPGDLEVIDDGGTPQTTDDVVIRYLNVDSQPPERDPVFGRDFNEAEQRNNASFVFKLIYGDVSFLFTGDINGRD